MLKPLLCTTALVFGLSSVALAQTTPSSPSNMPGTTGSSTTLPAGAGQPVVGTDVKNAANENIGEIQDVVISSDGKVEQVIVSVGGFLGVGSKRVAVAWNDLTMTGDTATVNMTKDQLKAAPEYQDPRRERPAPATPGGAGTAPGGAGSTPRTTN